MERGLKWSEVKVICGFRGGEVQSNSERGSSEE